MIENDVLHLSWYSGHASINLREFFPTSRGRTRKLFKCFIYLDPDQVAISEQLLHWLEDKKSELDPEDLRVYANKHEDYQMKIRELDEQIAAFRRQYPKARKRTDGQKTELRRLTDARSAANQAAKLMVSEFNYLKSALKLYQDDISEAEAQAYWRR